MTRDADGYTVLLEWRLGQRRMLDVRAARWVLVWALLWDRWALHGSVGRKWKGW